jgi:type I restriction enzyme, R subunit
VSPEQRARAEIDRLLTAAGSSVCNVAQANIHGNRGVAIREFPLADGYGFADYLLYVDAKAAGVIEAKKQGATLSGVEAQSAKYSKGLPVSLPAWKRPLPFLYESTTTGSSTTSAEDVKREAN